MVAATAEAEARQRQQEEEEIQENKMREQLLAKQQELINLKIAQTNLELAQAKAKNEALQKELEVVYFTNVLSLSKYVLFIEYLKCLSFARQHNLKSIYWRQESHYFYL